MTKNLNANTLFPSLVFDTTLDPFPQQNLIAVVNQVRQGYPSIDVSNVGGYHSPSVQLDIEPLNDILNQILKCQYKVVNTWFIVNGTGNYNTAHTHPQSDLSGVLYVTDSDAEIEFEHPQYFEQYTLLNSLKGFDEYTMPVVRYAAQAGRIILFPSSLRHRVLPNQSKDDRISISFNIKLNESSD